MKYTHTALIRNKVLVIKNTFLSESFPSLGAEMILASPEAENAAPANKATWVLLTDNWLI